MEKTPNPKLQAPKKLQVPSSKTTCRCRCWFEAWSLKFLWGLGFGVWSFHRFSLATIFLIAASSVSAADPFPFTMPGLEPNRGITDMSWLNDAPAGKRGFVRARDGHFVDGRGKRIKFLATNFTFGSCFPDHDTADKLAARLASLGINCIRFHHMDNQSAPRGIWKAGVPKRNEFDPDQLDRLDYFIAALKRHGIYANINLHVSRNYWEGEDFPDGLASDRERREKLPHYAKGLDKINDQMIRMQRDYARALLGHVNPTPRPATPRNPASPSSRSTTRTRCSNSRSPRCPTTTATTS